MTTLRKPDHLPANLVQDTRPRLPRSSGITQNIHIPQCNTLSLTPIDRSHRRLGKESLTTRPVFRYFTPLGPRKFCPPPPPICSYSIMCKQNQTQKPTKDETLLCFQFRSPLNFSLVDGLFFSRIPYFNLRFFFNVPPLEIFRPGPGPLWPVLTTTHNAHTLS
jgi:hypothetical protein